MSATKKVKVFRDAEGQWRFTAMKSSDNVATSGEGQHNKAHILEQVRSLFPESDGWVHEIEDDA
jgi:hypothetical protein